MSAPKTPLEEVFNTDEDDVKTFADILLKDSADILKEKVKKGSKLSGDFSGKFEQEEPDRFSSPDLRVSRNGYIEIAHGWHKDDYVLHIKPWHPKKQYRVTLQRVLFAIAKTMSKTIPDNIQVDVFPPNRQWEIPEITMKAKNLLDVWSVRNEDLLEMNEQIFKLLNALV